MSAIKRVSYLTTAHPDLSKNKGVSYTDCKGCSVCEEVTELRASIDRDPEERFKDILAKGPEMTTEEIKLLRRKGVQLRVLQNHSGFTKSELANLLKQLDQNKKINEEMDDMALTKEQLLDYEKAGVGPKEIAEKEGVSPGTVYTARSLHGLTKNKSPKKVEAAQNYEAAKNEVVAALATDTSLVAELRNKIARLEQQISNKDQRVEDLKEEIKNMEAAAEDLEYENNANLKLIHNLKVDKENLMVQVAEWKEKAYSYAKDNDLMNSTNKHLKSMMEGSTRKANILAAALKEVL